MGIKHLPAIDGLRAVAVLSVIAYHVGAPAGFVGVDVFFVISGYLITRILMERPPLVEFYARRARRILPAAFLVVSVTLALSMLLLPSSGDVARSAAAAGVFVANLFFQSATGGYWSDDAASMPLLHLWSLSVEEQFYLAWPLLILFGRKWIGWVFAGSLALYAYLSWANPEAAFYQTPARAWELAAGGLVAMFAKDYAVSHLTRSEPTAPQMKPHAAQPRNRIRRLSINESLRVFRLKGRVHQGMQERAGLVSRQVEGRFADNDAHADAIVIPNAVLPLDLEALGGNVPSFGHHQSRARLYGPDILRNLRALVLRHGSRIGVPLILLACAVPMPVWAAQPLAVLGAALVIGAVHGGASNRFLASRPMVGVGLISYSLYLWHWPLLALDRATRVGESQLGTRLALVAAAFVLSVLTYRYVEQPFRRMRVHPGRAVAFGVVIAAALSTTAFSLAEPPKKPVVIKRAEVEYCHPWGNGPAHFQPGRCVPNAPKVVLWGDSYTGAWEPYVLRMATENKWAAVWMVTTSCPPVVGMDMPRKTEKMRAHCRKKAESAYAYLKAYGADTVLVSSHWAKMLRERPDAGQGVLAWAKGLPNVRRIIVIGATPEIRDSVEKCQALNVSCDIPRADYEKSAAATKAVMRELDALPNVEVWQVGDWMCGATTCPGVRGVPLYHHDNHHITVAAAEGYLVRPVELPQQ